MGNTQTHIGAFDGAELLEHWRFSTDRDATGDQLAMVVHGLLGLRGIGFDQIDGEAVSSVVPKLALGSGIVYTYTKPGGDPSDPWFLTALDYRTGATIYDALAGAGPLFNNNYAPISIGPDGTAYIGVLGGIVSLRDAAPPQVAPRLWPT